VIERGVTLVLDCVVFVVWCCIGAVWIYAALYAFTPVGLVAIAGCAGVTAFVASVTRRTWPETIGLFAGPGVFCLFVARDADDPLWWTVVGWGFVGGAVLGYLAAQRHACARRS
jgi:hypothetical protein